jgi:DNA mismatch repair protein MutS
LFLELREVVKCRMVDLKIAAEVVALWDAVASLAKAALEGQYTRPQISANTVLKIRGGRHPVLETLGSIGEFVPNDKLIDHPAEFLHLFTGPNMAGNSTYLRQVGYSRGVGG